MGVVRRGNAAVECDHQADFADFLGRAAVVDGAVHMDLELRRPVDGGRHAENNQAADLVGQTRARPDVAVGIGVDHVLQRLAELADRAHALFHRLASENLLADSKPALVEFLGIHAVFSSEGKSMIPAIKKLLAAAVLTFAAGAALAQAYPSRTVKLVVPYGPGSSPDSVGRIIAHQMQEALGQTVIVSNVAGALANVGTAEVARAAPDGYTVLLTTNTPHAANVALFKTLPFDPVKDFSPIVRLITTSMVMLVRADFPANNLKEFIAYAKSKPQGLNAGYGSAASILSIAKLRTAAGFKSLDVAYKCVPLPLTDVLGGPVA